MQSLRYISKGVRHTALFLLAKAALGLGRTLPRKTGLRLFGSFGNLVFAVPHHEKELTIRHLRYIFGSEWSEERILATARGVYCALGKNIFDAIKLSRSTSAEFHRIVQHDDITELKRIYEEGRGIFVITAHTGCFELLLHFFARHGMRSFTIGRKLFDPRLDELIRSIRSGPNIEYMDRDDSSLKVVRYLKQGRVFGVLIDQDIRKEGVFGSFLGKTAFTVSGPFRMTMRMKTPVFVATTVRMPDDTHHVFISKQLEFQDTGDLEADLLKNVQMANDHICNTIRNFPDQWVWMHERWKQQPKDKKNED